MKDVLDPLTLGTSGNLIGMGQIGITGQLTKKHIGNLVEIYNENFKDKNVNLNNLNMLDEIEDNKNLSSCICNKCEKNLLFALHVKNKKLDVNLKNGIQSLNPLTKVVKVEEGGRKTFSIGKKLIRAF